MNIKKYLQTTPLTNQAFQDEVCKAKYYPDYTKKVHQANKADILDNLPHNMTTKFDFHRTFIHYNDYRTEIQYMVSTSFLRIMTRLKNNEYQLHRVDGAALIDTSNNQVTAKWYLNNKLHNGSQPVIITKEENKYTLTYEDNSQEIIHYEEPTTATPTFYKSSLDRLIHESRQPGEVITTIPPPPTPAPPIRGYDTPIDKQKCYNISWQLRHNYYDEDTAQELRDLIQHHRALIQDHRIYNLVYKNGKYLCLNSKSNDTKGD